MAPKTTAEPRLDRAASVSLEMAEMEAQSEPAADLLKAMANPYRLQVLCLLGEGELSVGALNQKIPLSQPALSQHLGVLRSDGLVKTRREAQTIYYRVAPGPTMEVIRVLHAHFCTATTAQ
jgi:DNA-binding transcriptional ArsR family regulator